jgi:hypothetical protein
MQRSWFGNSTRIDLKGVFVVYYFEVAEDMKKIFNLLHDKIHESENEFFDDGNCSEEFVSGYKNGIEMAMAILKEHGYSDEMKKYFSQCIDIKTKINAHKCEFEEKEYREFYNKLLEIVDWCNDKELLMVGKFFVDRAFWALSIEEDEKIVEEINKLSEITYKLQEILEDYV